MAACLSQLYTNGALSFPHFQAYHKGDSKYYPGNDSLIRKRHPIINLKTCWLLFPSYYLILSKPNFSLYLYRSTDIIIQFASIQTEQNDCDITQIKEYSSHWCQWIWRENVDATTRLLFSLWCQSNSEERPDRTALVLSVDQVNTY